MHSEQAWSNLTNTPVIVYHKRLDVYLAYWMGLSMTRSMAIAIAFEAATLFYVSPKCKQSIWNEFLQIYYSNGFGHNKWNKRILEFKNNDDLAPELYFNYMREKFSALLERNKFDGLQDPKNVLQWFTHEKISTVY